jgi:hypothetical protein
MIRLALGMVFAGLVAGCEENAAPVGSAAADAAVPVCVGCDPATTEEGYLATLSDQEIFPGLSPSGAALARSLMTLSDADATRLLTAATTDFDCGFAVTDDSYDRFAAWAGRHAARALGFTSGDAAAVAADLGDTLMARADWDAADLVLDSENALIGVGRCL